MALDSRPESAEPLHDQTELRQPFVAGFKPAASFRVGLEHENVGFDGLGPIPYAGPRGIEELLHRFRRFGFEPYLEKGRAIASLGGTLQLSLEPGGQFELAGSPWASIGAIAEEQARHLARLRALGAELGLTFTSVGYRPFGTVATATWMPKDRYQVMRAFLPPRGSLALDMMLMTGTAQVSVDSSDEADLAEKVMTAASCSSLVAALCANSPLVDGKPSGYRSYRCHVWEEVDNARCGLPSFLVEGFSVDRYIAWALDVPLIFIRRHGNYVVPQGMTFRRFLEEGFQGERASAVDWLDHLSTLFPDVRVKHVIELRTADAAGADLAVALAALWKGVLYDAQARAEVRALTSALSHPARLELRAQVARQALAAPLGNGIALDAARELVSAARRGLGRQGFGEEARHLEPFDEIARTGVTRSERLVAAFARGGPPAVMAAIQI